MDATLVERLERIDFKRLCNLLIDLRGVLNVSDVQAWDRDLLNRHLDEFIPLLQDLDPDRPPQSPF